MARDISPEEARDEKVYELTAVHYEKLHRQLQGGNVDLINTIDEAAFTSLPGSFWRDLVVDAAHTTRDAVIGARIRKLVEKALLDQAEIAAVKEVEQLEQDAKNDPDNCRPRTRATALWLVNQ